MCLDAVSVIWEGRASETKLSPFKFRLCSSDRYLFSKQSVSISGTVSNTIGLVLSWKGAKTARERSQAHFKYCLL